jgi:CheY-like chemotaxis protein
MRRTPPRVLVVDDDPDCREALVDFLESEGFAVGSACDGLEALERLRGPGGAPDLVLADMRMPRLDGEALAARIAADPALRAVPVVAMTAAIERPCPPGAVALVRKPFAVDELLRAIDAIVGREPRAACDGAR